MTATLDKTQAPPPSEGSRKRGRAKLSDRARQERNLGWKLTAPAFLAMMIVVAYPIIQSVIQSFNSDVGGIDPETGLFKEGGFVGLQNYTNWLFQQCQLNGVTQTCPDGTPQAGFYNAVFVTFFFAVVTVFFETIIGIWMAFIMNRNFKGRGILRAAVLIPWAIPTAVTAKLWYFIFDPSGVLNTLLGQQILWTSDLWASRWAIIIADTWKTTPFMALLILAGLQLIPEETYEAARMDGSSAIQTFFRITLPLLKPALVVAILFRALDALRMYDLPAILTGGGGGGGQGTTTLSILVVKQIQQSNDSASALSTITFLIIFAVAFVFIRLLGANITGNEQKSRKVAKEV